MEGELKLLIIALTKLINVGTKVIEGAIEKDKK